MQIVQFPGELQASREGRPDHLGIALREHHRDPERSLQGHLLPLVRGGFIERCQGLPCPAVALRQQREFEKELRRRSRQIDAD